MAGSARYTAILDANVLYPQLIRDTLLSLAVERLYHARWSATIHAEWTRNLAKDRPAVNWSLAPLFLAPLFPLFPLFLAPLFRISASLVAAAFCSPLASFASASSEAASSLALCCRWMRP